MTRLTQHQTEEENKTVLWIGIGALGLIIFIAFFGFKILLNSASLVNKVSGQKNVEQNEEDFFTTVSLDQPIAATNSANIFIEGSVNGFNRIEIFLNNTSIKRITLGTQTQFKQEVTGLIKGQNEIYVQASSSSHKQIKKSEMRTVFYKADKLTLEISSPSDGSTVNTEDTPFIGQTDPGSTVTINSLPAVVDGAGKFQKSIRLKEGDNSITVFAEDIGGNTLEKTINVKYQKEE